MPHARVVGCPQQIGRARHGETLGESALLGQTGGDWGKDGPELVLDESPQLSHGGIGTGRVSDHLPERPCPLLDLARLGRYPAQERSRVRLGEQVVIKGAFRDMHGAVVTRTGSVQPHLHGAYPGRVRSPRPPGVRRSWRPISLPIWNASTEPPTVRGSRQRSTWRSSLTEPERRIEAFAKIAGPEGASVLYLVWHVDAVSAAAR